MRPASELEALPSAAGAEQVPRLLVAFASQRRASLTPAQSKLWSVLRDRRLTVGFDCEVPLLDFIVDFYCPTAALVIEIDGEQHYGDAVRRVRDSVRTRRLEEELGVSVLRFSNDEVWNQFDFVVFKIADVVTARLQERAGI